ncbi:hypothetical protein D3C87_1245090 [compost metagenome]
MGGIKLHSTLYEVRKSPRIGADCIREWGEIRHLDYAESSRSLLRHSTRRKMLVTDALENLLAGRQERINAWEVINDCTLFDDKFDVAWRPCLAERYRIDTKCAWVVEKSDFDLAQQTGNNDTEAVESIRFQIEANITLHRCADRLVPRPGKLTSTRHRLASLAVERLQRTSDPG